MQYRSKNKVKMRFGRGRKLLVSAGIIAIAVVLVISQSKPVLAAQATIDSSIWTNYFTKWSPQDDTVFVSDQVGYIFYTDSGGTCVYSKTTDGGATWGSAVTIDTSTGCTLPGIWYDGWDLSSGQGGTTIRIIMRDTSTDDVYYNELDTSSDTLSKGSSPLNISTDKSNTVGGGGTLGTNKPFISRDTNGGIWAGLADSGGAGDQSWIKTCASSCSTSTNWVDATPTVGMVSALNDVLIYPQASGGMLLIEYENSTADVESLFYNGTNSTWDTTLTTIDGSPGAGNNTYHGRITAVQNKSTGTIYLAYVTQLSTLGTDDDIRTASYSSGSWTSKTDVLTNSSMGLTRANLAIDDNTGDIYAAYSALTTPTTPSTANIYYKKSTDGMSTWGTQSAALNTTATGEDIYGMKLNMRSNERIYVTWHDPDTTNTDKLYGVTLIDLTSTSNATPAAPTLNSPSNAATGVSTTPTFQMRTTDADNDYLRYKIDVCSTSNCGTSCADH
jgi:hypothetical protein